jgi:leucyl/phenylalanyl-tRNA--protein transferase
MQGQAVSGIWGTRDVPWIPPEMAEADGFVGIGGDLAPQTLLRAYSEGVFPWFNAGDPILWWSPDPRGVIELNSDPSPRQKDAAPGYGGLHVSRRLARTIRSGRFRVTVNQCFATVMHLCGATRPEGTWVTPDMLDAYTTLHRLGHAHSVETWIPRPPGESLQTPASVPVAEAALESDDWELAGGTYGLAIGGLFAAESMFYRVTDGSKVALAALVQRLRERGFTLLDVQMKTEHTTRMGATEIPRHEYLMRLRHAIGMTTISFV